MALIDIAEDHTEDELRTLAEAIRTDGLPTDRIKELEQVLRGADPDEFDAAESVNPAISELFAALELPPPVPGEAPVTPEEEPITEEELEEAGVEIEPEPGAAEDLPEGLEGVPQPGDGGGETRGVGGGARPDPRFASQVLQRRFPQPQIQSEFARLESARRNLEDAQDEDISPGRFYDEFAERVLGSNVIMTREEFVEAEQSSDATGTFR